MSGEPWSEERYVPDIEATSRRLVAEFKLDTAAVDIFGDHCVTCGERWSLSADKATCAHKAICEDCWPNGCEACEATVEYDLRRREQATNRIAAAALELRTSADDLSEADFGLLDWRVRKDVRRHIVLATEAMRRVTDILDAHERRLGQ